MREVEAMPISITAWKNHIRVGFLSKHPVRSWIHFAITMGLLTIGSANATTPITINVDRLPDDCYITDWYLLGPFALASVSDPAAIKAGQQHDYLSDVGFTETSFTLADLKQLSTTHRIFKPYRAASALLNLADAYPESDYEEVYAVAELRSNKDADIGIEIGSQDGLTLWVNGQP